MKTSVFLGLVALLADTSYLLATVSSSDGGVGCEIPNGSTRSNPSSSSFDVFADLLVWRAAESGSDNWAEVINSNGTVTKCDIREIEFDWNAGFRVGIGYGMKRDQWDTQFYYTRFNTQGNDRVSSNPGSVFSAYLGNFYIDNPTGAGIAGVAYQKASAHWSIEFNMFDWELGRAFWVSTALSVRPFIGLKGGWIDQSIDTKWEIPSVSTVDFFNVGTENLKNDFWGIGPSIGVNTEWEMFAGQNHSFALFGDFSGAIMWGHWKFGDLYKNDGFQEVSVRLAPISGGASMFRSVMGLEWDAKCCSNRFHFSTKLGYEMQFWLDQLQLYLFDTGRLSNVLTLQGGTLEFRFDF